jgi:hypothetical protein
MITINLSKLSDKKISKDLEISLHNIIVQLIIDHPLLKEVALMDLKEKQNKTVKASDFKNVYITIKTD